MLGSLLARHRLFKLSQLRTSELRQEFAASGLDCDHPIFERQRQPQQDQRYPQRPN
jgi:hypothetical protein